MTVQEYKEWKDFESMLKNGARLEVINRIGYYFQNIDRIMDENKLRGVEEIGKFFISSLKKEFNLH